jgi:hypothetical protein
MNQIPRMLPFCSSSLDKTEIQAKLLYFDSTENAVVRLWSKALALIAVLQCPYNLLMCETT